MLVTVKWCVCSREHYRYKNAKEKCATDKDKLAVSRRTDTERVPKDRQKYMYTALRKGENRERNIVPLFSLRS
jgi:hypothetical protein